MCIPWWLRRTPSRPPSHPLPDEQPISHSRSVASSSDYSKDSLLSSSSAASLAGIKDMLPDGPIAYKLAEIKAATNKLSATHQIGNSVWKGTLRGVSVAIVRKQGAAADFRKLLKNVCSLHHASVVKLLGGCKDGEFVYLVYDYVNAEDLGSCLRSKRAPGYTVLSSWKSRMQIALDVAKGLEYLHQHTLTPSVHKYMTSSNILVVNDNDNLRARISMVGLAALTGEVQPESPPKSLEPDQPKSLTPSRSVKIKGTHGYMPPEYLSYGSITQKYDVFGFGVVLLELLNGQEVVRFKHDEETNTFVKCSLIEEMSVIVQDADGSKGKLRLWIDPRLKDSYPVEDALKVAMLANSCLAENPEKRPDMSEVAGKLARFFDLSKRWERGRNVMMDTTMPEAR